MAVAHVVVNGLGLFEILVSVFLITTTAVTHIGYLHIPPKILNIGPAPRLHNIYLLIANRPFTRRELRHLRLRPQRIPIIPSFILILLQQHYNLILLGNRIEPVRILDGWRATADVVGGCLLEGARLFDGF